MVSILGAFYFNHKVYCRKKILFLSLFNYPLSSKILHLELGAVSEKADLNQATLIVCFQTNSKFFSKVVSGLC